jgi:hypothetical protein
MKVCMPSAGKHMRDSSSLRRVVCNENDTPPAVMLSVVREILDRSGYSETARISRTQLENELQELEAELTPVARLEYRHRYSVPEADGLAHECELCTGTD